MFAPTTRICSPIDRAEYDRILGEPLAFRAYLDKQIADHPELFPAAIQQGYQLHGLLPPSQETAGPAPAAAGAVFSVAPAFVMPYMTGYTEAVEKALFLRRFGVPFWGLTYVFGQTTSIGRASNCGSARTASSARPSSTPTISPPMF